MSMIHVVAVITANPGTGKTLLLAHKYLLLLNQGLSPDDILCLTFTNKAKKEMESRILKLIRKRRPVWDFLLLLYAVLILSIKTSICLW